MEEGAGVRRGRGWEGGGEEEGPQRWFGKGKEGKEVMAAGQERWSGGGGGESGGRI